MPRWPNTPRLHATQIGAWRKQALEHLSEVFNNGNPVVEDAELRLRELHAKVGTYHGT